MMPDDSLITEELLQALALRESSGQPDAVGDQQLRNPAYGMYQVRKPAYLDVVRLRKDLANVPFAQVQSDAEMNETFARAYLSVLANEYGLDTLDELLAGYNAGVGRVKQGNIPESTKRYVEDIKRIMSQRK